MISLPLSSVSQRYIRGESSIKTIPTDLLQLFTYSGPTLRQIPQYALELISSLYHGLIDSLTPIDLIYLIRKTQDPAIILPLVNPFPNFHVNIPLPTNATIAEADNEPPPALEALPELLEIVEEEIITPLSTSTALERINLPHASVASDSSSTSNDSVPSPTALNQEILIVEEIITSNSPLPTVNTPETIILPYIPVASGSGCTSNQETLIAQEAITPEPLSSTSNLSESIDLPYILVASGSSPTCSGSLLLPKELDQEEIIITAPLAPVQELNNDDDDDDEPVMPGAWFEDSTPAESFESEQTVLLRSFSSQSLCTVYNTDHVFEVEHKVAPQVFEDCAAHLAYQAGISAGGEVILQRDELVSSVRN